MSATRQELLDTLANHYRNCGWKVEHAPDGTVRATGPGGVTWIGLPVVAGDLEEPRFEQLLLDSSEERMPQGERCPLELLPAAECAAELDSRLERLRLADRGHVAVYSLAA